VAAAGPHPALDESAQAAELAGRSTPAGRAVELRSAFGERARMVTVDQGGHGVYPGPNRCGNTAVTNFLVTGERPPHDVRCAAQSGEGS
jgi:hypothetical protein